MLAYRLQSPIFMFDLFSDQEREWCERTKVNITFPGAADYPRAFEKMAIRPHFLTYWGQPVWNEQFCISIVGSRNPSSQSLRWMEQELPKVFDGQSVVVVSGGARGIDMKAHQLALLCRRPTIVFVPAGLMQVYPASLTEWIEPIVEAGGAVISQFGPNSQMRRDFFHARNRLIAGISELTFVVECKRRSGTLKTANFARELSKTLAVLPTFPYDPGLGGLDLICDGAFPIRDARDLSTLSNFLELINAESKEGKVGHPNRDRNGQLPIACETFEADLHCPINDDCGDANNHAAASRCTAVSDGAEPHTDKCEYQAGR